MNSNMKSMVTMLGFSLFVAGGYFALVQFDLLDSLQVDPAAVEQSTAQLEAEVLSELSKVQRINFDSTVFDREDFASLRDLSVDLPAPRVSRQNPFAELP